MVNIGISGKMYSGKTSAATVLMGMYPFIRMPFAGGLKEIVARIFGVPVDGPDKDRELLQWFGTDICRAKDPDCWARMLVRDWKMGGMPPIIVDDVRFPNEADILKANGFYLMRLEVSQEAQERRALRQGTAWDPDKATHQSEVALDDYNGWDLVINADLDLDPFQKAVASMWEDFILMRDLGAWTEHKTRRLF